MKQLTEKLQSLKNANSQIIEAISDMAVYKFFRKGLLLSTPDHCYPEIYFIDEGLVRGYFIHDGAEHTSWVLQSGFVFPTTSFFSKTPSIEYVDFLKDSSGYAINLQQWTDRGKLSPLFMVLLLELYEQNLQNIKLREQMLRIRHAETRFLYFKKLFPELINLPIHRVLASLLAIEPKYLFTIKRKYRR